MRAKSIISMLAAAMCFSAASAQKNYEIGIPGNSNYDYLKDYAPLKQYVDHTKYPNFMLAAGIGVYDYKNDSRVKEIADNYYDEVVCGNAMKMGSCVDQNGNMSFGSVTEFVNNATASGLRIYGHTLAWHSQQANAWLRSLIKDRPAPEDPEANIVVYQPVTTKDFRTDKSVGWHSDTEQYAFSLTFSDANGLRVHTTKQQGWWEVQFVAMTGLPLEEGTDYKLTLEVRASKAGTIHSLLGAWSGGVSKDIPLTTDWKTVEIDYKNSKGGDFLLIQCGDFMGDFYVRNMTLSKAVKARQVTEDRRCIVVKASQRTSNVWDNQFWIVTPGFKKGSKYEFSADVRADLTATASTQIHNAPGAYVHWDAIGNVYFTNEWKTVTSSGTLSSDGKSIAFNLSELADANNYYFDNLSFKVDGKELLVNGDLEGTDVSSFVVNDSQVHFSSPFITEQITYVKLPTSIPLSSEERHDTLVYAMDKWIKGIMTACQGKVTAWDVVNEAISGGDSDGDGYYDLQHADGYKSGAWDVGGDSFYWQDFMGDLDYVRQAVRLARKYGPDDLKLFINDYNLESFWDDNKKLKSLIHWIDQWEADGVTHIDGIGTQMHLSCSMDDGTLQYRKNYVEKMFRLMAATGRLVRVSELDMGMDDANGKSVATADMTEEMHQRMADYYEWIVKKYLEIVPPEQQWSICQWCICDSPEGSGWRANTPVGVWTRDYYRKHAYAGYVRGLGGVNCTGIETVSRDTKPVHKGIYTLGGQKQDRLPAHGIVIVDGKKIVL